MARVALVGDSHAQVLWPALTASLRAAGHTVVLSLAKPGWSEARYVKDGIAAKIRAASPDAVVFGLGGNNRESGAAYSATVRALLSTPARVIWIGPAVATKEPFARYHAATAALQAAVLPPLGVTWIDSAPYTRDGHRADGVHFTSYRAWAEGVTPDVLAAVVGASAGTPARRSPAVLLPGVGPLRGGMVFAVGGVLLALLGLLRWRSRSVAAESSTPDR